MLLRAHCKLGGQAGLNIPTRGHQWLLRGLPLEYTEIEGWMLELTKRGYKHERREVAGDIRSSFAHRAPDDPASPKLVENRSTSNLCCGVQGPSAHHKAVAKEGNHD